MPPQRVWFLRRFGLKTGIDVAHFCLETGMVIEGTTGLCDRICRFNSKRVRKKKKICEFKTDFKKSFLFCSYLRNFSEARSESEYGLEVRSDNGSEK